MKKTSHNKKIIAVTLLAVTFLGACSKEHPDVYLKETIMEASSVTNSAPAFDTAKANKHGISGEFPSSYNAQIGNCTFCIDTINAPEELNLYYGTASCVEADYLGLAKEMVKSESYTYDEKNGVLYEIESSNADFTKYKYYVVTDGTIYFIDYSVPYFNSVRLDYEDPYFNLNSYTAEHRFSFGSPEKCLEDIYSLFKRYGLDISKDYNVETYYLDHKTLEKEEKVYDKDGFINKKKNRPEGWSEHDDAYLFFLSQKCQGLPESFDGSFLWAGWFSPVCNAGLVFIYNEDGIQIVEPRQQVYKYNLNSEVVQLLPFDSVTNHVAEHLNGFADSSKSYEITKAKLYVAHDYTHNSNEEPLEYHWAFLVRENSNGKSKSYELYFNAVTGEYEEK